MGRLTRRQIAEWNPEVHETSAAAGVLELGRTVEGKEAHGGASRRLSGAPFVWFVSEDLVLRAPFCELSGTGFLLF